MKHLGEEAGRCVWIQFIVSFTGNSQQGTENGTMNTYYVRSAEFP